MCFIALLPDNTMFWTEMSVYVLHQSCVLSCMKTREPIVQQASHNIC
jgi:hypothetical protein